MDLITNRTPKDVERWKTLRDKGWDSMSDVERQEWLGEIETTPSATRGMYTHNDLNRVEKAVESISRRLLELEYITLPLVVKTDWTYTDDVWKEDIERYLNNIKLLRDTGLVYPSTPALPSIKNKMTYSIANDIEKILMDIDDLSTRIINTRLYVGEIMSGEV